MGVVYVKELFDGRTGSDGIERRRQYVRRFEVRTSSPNDDVTVAVGTDLLPRNGQPYPLDAYALMVKIEGSQSAEDSTLWYVTCNYDTELPSQQAREAQGFDPVTGQSMPTESSPEGQEGLPNPRTRPENPLDRPAVWGVEHEESREIIKFDSFGNPILNCADEPYDPPPEDEVSMAVATLTKNLAVVEFFWLEGFVDSVNADVWMNRAPRTCRIQNISYQSAVENGVSFWRTTFRIKIKPQTWDMFLLERGKNYKSEPGALGIKVRIDVPAGSGIYPDEPQLLDGERIGGVVSADGIADITNVDFTVASGAGRPLPAHNKPVYTRWRVKKERDFSALGI